MQKMIGYMRKAVQDYQMLQDGDRVAVGVSGGKDSLVTLLGLARLRQFLGVDFSLTAVTVDPGFGGKPGNYGEIRALCEENGIPYLVKQTQIGPIIFDIRKESNPCALCAKMRRGSLHDAAKEAGCNKLALGHNYDDAVETFVMNLFNEGRIGCFSPVTYLSRKDITVLRPPDLRPGAGGAGRCPPSGAAGGLQRLPCRQKHQPPADKGMAQRHGAGAQGDQAAPVRRLLPLWRGRLEGAWLLPKGAAAPQARRAAAGDGGAGGLTFRAACRC